MLKTIAVLFLASTTLAQAQNKLSDHNNWNDDEADFSAEVANVPVKFGKTAIMPTAVAHFATTVDMFSNTDRFEIKAGYSPEEYLRLRYQITVGSATSTGDNDKSFFILFPVIGDLRVRPGLNQLGYSENSSTFFAWFGAGIRRAGNLNERGTSNFRANATLKWIRADEALAPGQYTDEGSIAASRGLTNLIQANGPSIEVNAQLVILDKFLIGIGGEGARISENGKNQEGDEVTTSYTNYEGKVYAQVRVKRGRGFTVDVLASYYGRLTNLTNFRNTRTISVPSVGIRLSLGR